ncbi:MAG: hypothetical protein U1C58_13000 [Flavobacteriaceae bacterium]|jgi:hypothetical protein|nr:hypothetical protein [Flavobacteriaceae bacterium]MDZ4149201.1 hypothetical protein [Flavobacteriaceae bacterium]
MREINTETDLRSAIEDLEIRQSEEGQQLKQQFRLTYESVKPINLIKSTFKEAAESTDLKNNILSTAFGLATGFVSKTAFIGLSNNPIKKIIGNGLLFGVTNVITKNPKIGIVLLDGILKIIRKKPNEVETERNQLEKEENLFI